MFRRRRSYGIDKGLLHWPNTTFKLPRCRVGLYPSWRRATWVVVMTAHQLSNLAILPGDRRIRGAIRKTFQNLFGCEIPAAVKKRLVAQQVDQIIRNQTHLFDVCYKNFHGDNSVGWITVKGSYLVLVEKNVRCNDGCQIFNVHF